VKSLLVSGGLAAPRWGLVTTTNGFGVKNYHFLINPVASIRVTS
jgi:hypothetical protein